MTEFAASRTTFVLPENTQMEDRLPNEVRRLTIILFQFDQMLRIFLLQIQTFEIFVNIVHALSPAKGVNALIVVALRRNHVDLFGLSTNSPQP